MVCVLSHLSLTIYRSNVIESRTAFYTAIFTLYNTTSVLSIIIFEIFSTPRVLLASLRYILL